MQWIETNQNSHKRRVGGPYVEQSLKSRLVACGNYERQEGLRTDSPTCDMVGHYMLCSWAACNRIRLRAADVASAYFQGAEMDRLLLLRQRRGGLPDKSIPCDAMIIARVPIYGTQDAGRGFWKKARHEIIAAGLRENQIVRCFYHLTVPDDEGIPRAVVVLITHVDDYMWAAIPGYENVVPDIFAKFSLREFKEGEFRFCGKEYAQQKDCTIHVTCKDNSLSIEPISYDLCGRTLSTPVAEAESTQLRSVTGALGWNVRQCRPDLDYFPSKLQSVSNAAQLCHLKLANRVLVELREHAEFGLVFRAGAFKWEDAILVTMSDANFAKEQAAIDSDTMLANRSQRAHMLMLAAPELWDGSEADAHVLSFKSAIIRRVCKSTLVSEGQGIIKAVDDAHRIRATMADMDGRPDLQNWEGSSAVTRRCLWLSDCEDVVSHLTSPYQRHCEDGRLAIDISSLRQLLWEKPDGSLRENIDEDATDKLSWIDTSAMLVDCMTKRMRGDAMREFLQSGRLSLNATDKGILQKMKKKSAQARKLRELLPGD